MNEAMKMMKASMELSNEQILESFAEMIRSYRRWGQKYPTHFEIPLLIVDAGNNQLDVHIIDAGVTRKFTLELHEHNTSSVTEA